MICVTCKQEVEDGAAFCGNCGQPMQTNQQTQVSQPVTPEYAVAKPVHHSGEIKALLSVIFGVIGIPASIMPFAGIALGTMGLILGTMSRRSRHKLMSTIGIVASCIAILVSLGVWTYAFTHEKELSKMRNKASGATSSVRATSLVSTPCYNLQFGFTLNTDHDEYDECDVRVFEGATIDVSNNVYKVYANKVPTVTEANFAEVAKAGLEKDIASTLPDFKIKGQRIAQFAGSPAYILNAYDETNDIAVVEAAVLRPGKEGYNLYSLVHATKGESTDLRDLESAWQWKD